MNTHRLTLPYNVCQGTFDQESATARMAKMQFVYTQLLVLAGIAGKVIIKGVWDTPGSHQVFVGHKTTVLSYYIVVNPTSLRSFLKQLRKVDT